MKNESLWPVEYDDKLWYEEDCGDIFLCFYHDRMSLRADGCVYASGGSWVFPDDTFEHDDNR
jgi:hypothetical protein